MNYLSKRISQSFGSIASENSKTKTSPMPILLTGITFLVLCFFASSTQLEAQNPTFEFAPTNFTVVWQNSGKFIDPISGDTLPVFQYLGEVVFQHLGKFYSEHCYNVVGGFANPGFDIDYTATAMWHNSQIDLQKEFVFTCKLLCNHNYSRGFTFILHNVMPQNCSNLIGMSGCHLGYGWTANTTYPNNLMKQGVIPPSPISNSFAIEFDMFADTVSPTAYDTAISKLYLSPSFVPRHISYLQNSDMTSNKSNSVAISLISAHWHCVDVIWKRKSPNSDTFELITFWDGVEKMRKEYNGYQGLGLSSNLATFGITAACDTVANQAAHLIRFVKMENSHNINFDKFFQEANK